MDFVALRSGATVHHCLTGVDVDAAKSFVLAHAPDEAGLRPASLLLLTAGTMVACKQNSCNNRYHEHAHVGAGQNTQFNQLLLIND